MMRNIYTNGMMNNITPPGFVFNCQLNNYNHYTPSVLKIENNNLNLKLNKKL